MRNLPIIECECGHKILLIPDVHAMGQVIKKHALEHKDKYDLTKKETEALEDALIAKALKMASKNK